MSNNKSDQKKPEILGRRLLGEGRLFQIEELHLRFSNGEIRYFERLKPRGTQAVLVVPFLDNDHIVLIREYGAGIEDYYLSLPKGLIDPGETALEAANRELKEEVGYGSDQLTEVRRIASSPGYNSNQTRIVAAQALYPASLPGDEPEPIEPVIWPVKAIPNLMKNLEFSESRSIAALYIVKDWYDGQR